MLSRNAESPIPSPIIQTFWAIAMLMAWSAAGAGNFTLAQGPMLGGISDTGVRVWVRVDGTPPDSYEISVTYGRTSDAVRVTTGRITVDSGTDFSGAVTLSGLAPNTEYSYRVNIDGNAGQGERQFVTLPPQRSPSRFRFGFGSCTDQTHQPFSLLSSLAAESLSFFIHSGDLIYADRAPAAVLQDEFSAVYQVNFSDSNWRALAGSTPMFMMWDDHELENDWNSGQSGLYAPARAAFDIYISPQNPAPLEPDEIYYTFASGQTEFFVLDTRSHRDPSAGTMLGSTQKQHLKQWLTDSDARFKFIVSSVQWNDLARKDDGWFGFPEERQEIFDTIRDEGVFGVVLLSGDRHWVGVFQHDAGEGLNLYELSASPLGAAAGTAPSPNRETLYLYDLGLAYMTAEVDTTIFPGTVDIQVHDAAGAVVHQLTLDEEQIRPVRIHGDGFEADSP